MKILMSAFSCGPGHGSEAGIGWNIAVEAARLGHDITLLTTNEFGDRIQAEIDKGAVPEALKFVFIMPGWLEWLREVGLKTGYQSLTWHVNHFLWQFVVLRHARRIVKEQRFDIVHHSTHGTIRQPTRLGKLGLPLVLGPLGGGEFSPSALRKSLNWRDRVVESVRDWSAWVLRLDPLTQSAFRDASLIIVRTFETKAVIPRRFHDKLVVHLGIGISEKIQSEPALRSDGQPFKLFYCGRLVGWKGVHLALRAVSEARGKGLDARFTIVGDGPARAQLEELANALGLAAHVTWRGWLDRAEVLTLYKGQHAFLFPSLHDSAGMVLVEAWAHGLPVICLKLGGPGVMVDNLCGRSIPVVGQTESDCISALAAAIVELGTREDVRHELSKSSIDRYADFSWPRVVADLYADIQRRVPIRAGSEDRSAFAATV